ncbi:hypothetical protein CUN91_00380 [Candidatus Carsonella ruddii]|uniref:Ribosomal protein L1 n=1 Tax=Carsonella ruddii TaxID=114186 RepID=A0A2K8K979_CARRU|nr:hypothetical protein [Candidatus Carsonella ruddii]ATX33413.1 hypothetical protein CUN91_00380 [Candidatus Carsonella ruddii]
MNNSLINFCNFFLNKKFNFTESIDLNIIFNNKKKNYFNFFINLFYSVNDNKKILFLSDKNSVKDNIYIGNNYFNNFLEKKIFFDKIFYNKDNFFLIKKHNLVKKFSKKKNLINNYELKINELKNKIIKIIINKNNFLNFKIGNINFNSNMIEKNYFYIINYIKKIFFKNNIIIENIYINTTMSKSYIIK